MREARLVLTLVRCAFLCCYRRCCFRCRQVILSLVTLYDGNRSAFVEGMTAAPPTDPVAPGPAGAAGATGAAGAAGAAVAERHHNHPAGPGVSEQHAALLGRHVPAFGLHRP